MIYGIILCTVVVLCTILVKTFPYVDKEARDGVGRLVFFFVGTAFVLLLIIFCFRIVVGAL